MTRPTAVAVLLALLAVLSAVALGPPVPASAAGGQSGTPTDTPTPTADGSASAGAASAGEHLSGALSVQGESVSRDLSRLTLAARVAGAPDNASRARALAGECDRLRERMRSMQERERRLGRALENGTLTRGEFRAKMTALDADARTVADLAGSCIRHGERLPEGVTNATAINVSDYDDVGRQARAFSRRELAEHSFDLGGNGTAFARLGRETITNDSLRNASEDQREAIAETEAELAFSKRQRERVGAHVNETAPDDEEAREALACADEALAAARADLDRARAAAGEGDDAAFDGRMTAAREHMRTAESCIERAYEEAGY